VPTLIKIEFSSSSSKFFKEALRVAKRFPGFAKEGKNGPYSVEIETMDELLTEWQNFNQLHFLVSSWSKTKIYFKDNLVLRVGKRNDFFYSILEIYTCYKNYLKDPYKPIYCGSGDWSCKKLRAINRHIKKYAWGFEHYYKYGHFKNSQTWVIDKSQIKQILTDEATERCLEACPVFRVEDIDPLVATLPHEIHLEPENWEIGFEREYTEKGFVLVPKTISHVEKDYPEMVDTDAFNDPLFEIEIPDSLTNEEVDRIIDSYLNSKRTKQ